MTEPDLVIGVSNKDGSDFRPLVARVDGDYYKVLDDGTYELLLKHER